MVQPELVGTGIRLRFGRIADVQRQSRKWLLRLRSTRRRWPDVQSARLPAGRCWSSRYDQAQSYLPKLKPALARHGADADYFGAGVPPGAAPAPPAPFAGAPGAAIGTFGWPWGAAAPGVLLRSTVWLQPTTKAAAQTATRARVKFRITSIKRVPEGDLSMSLKLSRHLPVLFLPARLEAKHAGALGRRVRSAV